MKEGSRRLGGPRPQLQNLDASLMFGHGREYVGLLGNGRLGLGPEQEESPRAEVP